MPTTVFESQTVADHHGRDFPSRLPETLIQAECGWRRLCLGELWEYRDLISLLIWRNVKVRYKQTALGALWAILQPTLMMVVLAIVFGRMAGLNSAELPYPVFLYAGLLPWTYFSSSVLGAANSVVESERIVTKVYFPRLALPISAIGAALVDFMLAFSVLIALMFFYGISPSGNLIFLPLGLVLLCGVAIGVGTMIAALNVAYRDFRYVVTFLMQIWMFATPSIYMDQAARPYTENVTQVAAADASTVQTSTVVTKTTGRQSDIFRSLLNLNPMTPLINFFRATLLGQPLPWKSFCLSSVLIGGILVGGLLYFRRVEDSFADII